MNLNSLEGALRTKETTKFILVYQKVEGQTFILLADATDRMVMGSVSQGTAAFGPDGKTALLRSFLDDESALEWLKEQARLSVGRRDVDFLREDMEESRVTVPRGKSRLFQ